MNNVWRALPEFHQLDTIISVPFPVQTAAWLATVLLAWLVARARRSARSRLLAVLVVAGVACVFSWYRVILSDSTNSIRVELWPLLERNIPFAHVESFHPDDDTLRLTLPLTSVGLHTGWYPLGIDTTALHEAMLRRGNCTAEQAGRCTMVRFEAR